MDRLHLRSLAAIFVSTLVIQACGDGTTTAPDTHAPAAIAPVATPTTVEIAPSAADLVVEAFFEAFNEGDIGRLRSIYSDDVTLTAGPLFSDDEGLDSIKGSAALLEEDREDIDLRGHYTPSNIRAARKTVTSQFTYRDEDLAQEGLAPISGSMLFKVEQGQITTIVITFDEESKRRFAEASRELWEAIRTRSTCPSTTADKGSAHRPPLLRAVLNDDGWETGTPAEAGFDQTAIQEMTEDLRSDYYGNIHALLIEHDGKLVYEEYFTGPDYRFGQQLERVDFTRETLHDLQSISKSVTSALLGPALGPQFEEALDKPILDFFPELADSAAAGVDEITLRHVLTMTSGLEWNATDVPYKGLRNDQGRLARSENPIAFVLSRPTRETPGERWYYNGGLTELVAGVIQRLTGQPLSDYARQVLFDPLGITYCEWVGPPLWRSHGVAAAWGLRMRARDLAKIGSVFLHDGTWRGRQILPREWVEASMQRHTSLDTSWSQDDGYGYQWWHGSFEGREGAYTVTAGVGAGGQRLFIVPKERLVVTVFAGDYNNGELGERILERIVAARQVR